MLDYMARIKHTAGNISVMKYLKRFLTILIDYFPKKRSVTDSITAQEALARFITSKRWYSREKNVVKPQAFMPPPDLRLSVFRIDNLSESEIWKIGFKKVISNMNQPRNLHGRADIQALKISQINLQINPDNTPPIHANKVGWLELKEERKSIAQELAAKASLRLHTS
jgi:hypothetical protein